MVDFRVELPGSEKDQPKFNYSSAVEAPGAQKFATKKSGVANLIDGVAAIGDGVIKATDAILKSRINDETTAAVDQVREEYAANGDLYGGRDITNDPQSTPEIEKQLKYAREIHQGYMAGTIRDSNYWARLDSISRQLRTRYPGYREYIDDKLSGMVGGTPANRLREALANEAQAEASKKLDQSPLEKIQWASIKDAVDKGIMNKINPAWQEQIANGTFDMNENVKHIGAFNLMETETKVKQNQIALTGAENELNAENAKSAAQSEINMNVNSLFLSSSNALGKQYNDMFNEFRKMAQEGRIPESGPELEKYLSGLNGMELATKGMVTSILGGPWKEHPDQSYNRYLTKDQQDLIMQDSLRPIQLLRDFVETKNTGLLDRVQTSVKYTTDGNTKRMLESNKNFQLLNSAKDIVGPEGIAILYQHNPEFMGSVSETLSDAMLGDIITGNSDSVVQTIRTVRDRTGEGSKEVNSSVRYLKGRLINYLQSDVANPSGFRNVANALYNSDQNLLTLMSPDEAAAVLGELTTPEMTRRMQEMTKYDPELYKKYERWATNGFLHINRSALQTIRDVKVNRKFLDVTFDPKTLQFKTVSRTNRSFNPGDFNPLDPLNTVQGVSEAYLNKQGKDAINTVNRALANFKPFADATGTDMGGVVAKALEISGVDMSAPYEGPSLPNTVELGAAIGGAFRRWYDKINAPPAEGDQNTYQTP